MSQFPNTFPGIGATANQLQLIPRMLFIMDTKEGDFLPGGKPGDGYSLRDPDNTIAATELRPGLILGKITNSGTASGSATAASIGLLGASIIGTLKGAITNATTQTTGTLTTAAAAELVRRVGSVGTLVLTGSPTSGGVVASQTISYSSVVTSTGVITWTAPQTAFVAGTWVSANDGSATPFTVFAGDVYNLRVTDNIGNNIPVAFRHVPITNKPLLTANIINYPSAANTGLNTYLKSKLRVAVPAMAFDDDF